MIDKPIAAKIFMTLADKKSSGEDFISLSGSLYHEGLIYGQPRELRKHKNVLELIVTFTDIYSYKNWLKNDFIKEYWNEKFNSLLAGLPKTVAENDVIIEVDNVKNCSCKDTNIQFYLLDGRRFGFVGGLTCGNCLGLIPDHKIPENIKLESWLSLHENVYRIWLDSGVLEKWALKELTNYKKGKLNSEGEKIRKELSEYFQKPVYISYFVEEPDSEDLCLICGSKGKKSGLKRPNKVCNKCFTAFDYTK